MSKTEKSARSVCIFCGSSEGLGEGYMQTARETGLELAKNNLRLVYGGGGTGLMGASAKAAHEAGGDVLGIMPEFLVSVERAYMEVETRIVPDMHVRKMQMFEESNAFIILPGGIGTLEEVMEVLSWQRLQLHQKPIVFLAHNDYWAPLIAALRHTIHEKFSPDWMMDDVFVASNAKEAVQMILNDWNGPQKELRSIAPIEKV